MKGVCQYVVPKPPQVNDEVWNRFWAKVRKSDACWEWTASRSEGYGQFRANGRKVLAHRWLYEQLYGPLGQLKACHTCDNPGCCRPDHLFRGTQRDNVVDAVTKGRMSNFKKGVNHHNAKLTEMDIVAIRADRRPQGLLGTIYGVDGSQICRIRTGKMWASVK